MTTFSSVICDFRDEWATLSNFYPVVIEFQGITYPSVEHAYQAAKTADSAVRLRIAAQVNAGVAKRLGRRITETVPHWNEYARFAVMQQLIELKFSIAHRDLQSALLATGDALLIEGNTWHDNTWGSCVCEKCGRRGANALGRMLMDWRDELNQW